MAPNVVAHLYHMVEDLYAEHGDPRVAHLPLVGNLWYVLSIIAVYLAFVLHFGPQWMARRKPYEVKTVMQLYNIIQVVANGVLFLYGFVYSVLDPDYSLICQPVDHGNRTPQMMSLVYASYGYYMLKYLDLLDTVSLKREREIEGVRKRERISALNPFRIAGLHRAAQEELAGELPACVSSCGHGIWCIHIHEFPRRLTLHHAGSNQSPRARRHVWLLLC